MVVLWGQLIMAGVFLRGAVALRIWAARKYARVREQVESGELREAFEALRAASDVTFVFLVMTLVVVASQAWSKL